MCSGDDQQGIGRGDLFRKAPDGGWTAPFQVWIIHRQVIDPDEVRFHLRFDEPDQSLRKLPIDRLAPIAADDNGEFQLPHNAQFLRNSER